MKGSEFGHRNRLLVAYKLVIWNSFGQVAPQQKEVDDPLERVAAVIADHWDVARVAMKTFIFLWVAAQEDEDLEVFPASEAGKL